MDSGRFLFDSSGGHGNMLFLGNGESHFRGLRSMLDMEKSLKRPSFYCSSDDLFSDDYYDEQLPEKKRRLTPEQVDLLEKSFEAENKLEPDRKAELSKKLGLQPRQVAVWFQNRRARWKTKQLERDYDHLKSSYDSLLSDYDLILKENEKLRTEVSSLNEKLHTKGVDGAPFPDLKPDPIPFVEVSVKMEDHMSSGSGGSSVIDEESPQLVDSGDSYFLEDNDYPEHVGTIDAVHSEDDGTDDGRGYFSDVFVAAEEQQVPSGWWVWS